MGLEVNSLGSCGPMIDKVHVSYPLNDKHSLWDVTFLAKGILDYIHEEMHELSVIVGSPKNTVWRQARGSTSTGSGRVSLSTGQGCS